MVSPIVLPVSRQLEDLDGAMHHGVRVAETIHSIYRQRPNLAAASGGGGAMPT